MNAAHNPHPHADWFQPMARAFSAKTLARYSSFVNGMKIGLPVLAALLLLVLVIVPNANNPPPPAKKDHAVDATMHDPVYTSRDSENRPYQVKGDEARQHPELPNVTTLTNPKGEIELNSGDRVKGDAKNAVYDQNNGTLQLQGDLILRHSDGTTFTTQGAAVDVNGKNAKGDQPVTLQGGFGIVKGSGFEARDGGKIIIFTGPSSATLNMGNGTGEKKP